MKYVMFEISNSEITRSIPIIFPSILVHQDVARKILSLLESQHKGDIKIVSAGELNLIDSNVGCFGYSETLDLKSRGEMDSEIIRTYNYTHGL